MAAARFRIGLAPSRTRTTKKTTGEADHAELIERETRGLFRNAVALGLGQGGVLAFGLGAMVLTTRLLGLEGYGRLTVFFMCLGVVTQLVIGWPNLAVVRFGRVDLAARREIGPTFWGRLLLYLLCGVGGAGALLVFRGPLGRYLGLGPWGVDLLIGYALLLSAVEMLQAVFQALGRFRVVAVLGACVKFLNFLLVLGLFLSVRKSGAPTVIGLHLASLACVLVVAVWLTTRAAVGRVREMDAGRVRAMAAYAWPVLFGGLAGVVVEWVDTIVLKACGPMAEVGAYGAAYQAVNALGGLRAALVTVLWPYVMSLAVEGRRETLSWYLDDFLPAGTILLGLGLAVTGVCAEAMPLLFGADFRGAVWPCQVLVAGVAFTGIFFMLQNVANAFDRVKSVAVITVVMAVVNLVGDVALVPRLGPMGAALSTLIAFAVSAFLIVRVVNGIAEIRGDAPGRRYLAAGALAPALAVPAVRLAISAPWVRVAVCLGAVALWAVAVRLSGAFRPETLDRLDRIALPRPARWALSAACAVLGRRREAEL